MDFKGLYTALITPFATDESVDVEGLVKLIQRQNDAKVDGIVLLGTTGESCTIDQTERDLIVKTAVEHAKVPVIVGTGSSSTRTAVDFSRRAESLGANGILVVTPYYNKPSPDGLFLHYKAIHDAVQLPIMLYNNPGRCGLNVSPENIVRLASLERVTALKDSSGSVNQLGETLALASLLRPGFSVLSGDDSAALPSIALGAVGLVSVVSNLYPKEMRVFVDMCLRGDFAAARVEHYRWLPVIHELFAETNPISVKAAMRAVGLPAGKCRLPL